MLLGAPARGQRRAPLPRGRPNHNDNDRNINIIR